MAFASARDFSVNHPVMLDQSNTTSVVNEFNMITSEIRNGRLSPISQVPPSTTQMFTGQEIYLDALHKHYKNDKNDKSRKYFLLYGMGGIGKTQICLKYKDDSEDYYEYMFWIDSTSEETINQSLKDIYKSYPAVQHSAFSANAVLTWISLLKTKWIIIYDNADGTPEVVENRLPPGNKGNILITSRNQALRRITTDKNAMEVTEMTHGTAVMLLLKSSGLDSHYWKYKDVANDIVSELYDIPLAISQAGAYIMHGKCNITNYLDIYRQHRATLLSNEEYGGASKYNKSVYGTWELSYQQLIKMSRDSNKANIAKYAIGIINISAFYHHLNIPTTIFERAAENYPSRMEQYADDIRPVFIKSMNPNLFYIDENGHWDESLFNQAIALLLSFSLIKKDSSAYFSFHPLIQQWCQDRLPHADRLHWNLVSGGMLATSITNEDTISEVVYLQQIALHLSNIVAKINGLQYYHDIFYTFAIASKSTGNYVNAYNLLKEVNKMNEKLLPQNHGDILTSMSILASTYRDLGKLSEAEDLLIQVLHARKRMMGDEHPSTLTTMSDLALTYCYLGKLPEAEGLHIQHLEACKRILGDEHPDTLTSMHNLALTLSEAGKLSEAEGLQIQHFKACKRILGDEHPYMLSSMSVLAFIYSKLGKLSEVEYLQNKVLETRKRILGNEHPDTLKSMSDLALTYYQLGQLSKAENLHIHALDAQKKILGNEHVDTLTTMNNLAFNYIHLEKWSEAETLRLQELEERKSRWGEEHSDTLQCMTYLYEIYLKLGKTYEAELLRLQIIYTRERMRLNGVELTEYGQRRYEFVYKKKVSSDYTQEQAYLEISNSEIVKKKSKMQRIIGKFRKILKLHK